MKNMETEIKQIPIEEQEPEWMIILRRLYEEILQERVRKHGNKKSA